MADDTMAEVADENIGSVRLTRSASKKSPAAKREESGLSAIGSELIKFDVKEGTQLGAAVGAEGEESAENVKTKPDKTKWTAEEVILGWDGRSESLLHALFLIIFCPSTLVVFLGRNPSSSRGYPFWKSMEAHFRSFTWKK